MKLHIRVLSTVLALSLCLGGCAQPVPETPTINDIPEPVIPLLPEQEVLQENPDPVLTTQKAEEFVLSFAGDCTFGNNYNAKPTSGFLGVVGKKYDYPFSNVKTYFENDDFTFVNLECALTESDPTEEEMEELSTHRFRFRGPKDYAKILTQGSVEFASCANNHSKDYGRQGLYDTWDALEEEGIHYASFGKTAIATSESGLTVGLIACFFWLSEAQIRTQSQKLREQGAELIVVSIHWGDEGVYSPNSTQKSLGRQAIDGGADIVFGHHSHTLQWIEPYNGGIIYYSLGNFSFGGNANPGDKDSAIIQQKVLRYEDGTIALGDLDIIPCRVSSVTTWNDFRPTPMEKDTEEYNRVLQKLEGSYDGEDHPANYPPMPNT